MSKKEYNSKCKEVDETFNRTVLVPPGNGRGVIVILIGDRSSEQVILPYKSVRTLARFHIIFLIVQHQKVIIKKGKTETKWRFSSARTGYILAQRTVRSTSGSQSQTSCGSRSWLLSDRKLVCSGEIYDYFYSIRKISLSDVEERSCDGHNEEHYLKSAFHCKKLFLQFMWECRVPAEHFSIFYGLPHQNFNYKSSVYLNETLFNIKPNVNLREQHCHNIVQYYNTFYSNLPNKVWEKLYCVPSKRIILTLQTKLSTILSTHLSSPTFR